MYQYNTVDQRIVDERVAQFRDQVRRRLSDELTEDEFRPLRLMNGLYHQRHAYMLRVAIPYGLLSSRQLRQLAHIARIYDKGYGHFTTRQNIQYNWPELEDTPDILADLAAVEMHAIQTSGNCVRNISADHLAGISGDEAVDPRPYCEIMRQWSTFHPEFAYLPRKFKLAFTGADTDRAAIRFHDIGYQVFRDPEGETRFAVYVGGGLGRTPVIGQLLHPSLPERDLIPYTEAILRVYNRAGNRDNMHKARIKILVRTMGLEAFRAAVEDELPFCRAAELTLTPQRVAEMAAFFDPPDYLSPDPDGATRLAQLQREDPAFDRWVRHNTVDHKQPGYRAVVISLKAPGVPPGDATDEQMDALADLADEFSLGQIRTLHTQNLLFADVRTERLHALWQHLRLLKLAEPNVGTLTDIICCPGLDFCSLANARSIPVVHQITDAFEDYDYLYDLGELKLKISGCINACAHHHIGHIGILGIDKQGIEYYQVMLGGSEAEDASLGKFIGPAFPTDRVVDALRALLDVYVELRAPDERFIDTYRRVGVEPFKERAYAG